LYLLAILWSFSARSPSRAWLALAIVTLVSGGLTVGLIALVSRS
jgi:hypothetical protein